MVHPFLPGFNHSGTSTADRPAWLHLHNAINICSTSMLVSVRLHFFLLVPISATQFLALVLSASIRLTSPYHPSNLLSWFITDDITAIAAHKVYPSLYLLYNTNYTPFCTTLDR
jgi:hypothetical protein